MLTIEQAALALADATAARDNYDLVHADVKLACLTRLVTQPNPLAKGGALHSASSAEAVLEHEPDYRASRGKRTTLAVTVILAQGDYDAAKANGLTEAKVLADPAY